MSVERPRACCTAQPEPKQLLLSMCEHVWGDDDATQQIQGLATQLMEAVRGQRPPPRQRPLTAPLPPSPIGL